MTVAKALNSLFGSQLRRNIASGMGTAVLSAILGLGSYPMYLHFLGYEKYGLWLALSTVLTFAQLGNFGLNPAVSKLVAEAYGAGDTRAVQRVLTTAWIVVSVSGAGVFCAVLMLRQYIPRIFNVSGANLHMMSALLPYVALFSIGIFIVETVNAGLVGLGRMDLESYFRIISQAIALVCSALLLLARQGVAGVLVGNAVAYVVMHIMSVIAVRKILMSGIITTDTKHFHELPRMLSFGGWVFGAAIINLALSPFNRVVLSRFVGLAMLPVYEIAYGSAMKVRSLLDSGLRAMMPEISRLGSSLTPGTLKRANGMQRSGLRLIAGLGAPLYGVVILLATPLLHMWLRSQFQPALPFAFRIMLIGSFVSLLGVPGYYILLGLGQARRCFLTVAILGGTSMGAAGFAFLLSGSVTVVDVTIGMATGMGLSSIYVLWAVARLSPTRFNLVDRGMDEKSQRAAMPEETIQVRT